MKYTALEILEFAGVENPKKVLGKMSVSIAGIAVNTPDHLINMQDAKSAVVIVGKDTYDAELPEQEEVSDAVKTVLKSKGKVATEKFEARAAEKAQ